MSYRVRLPRPHSGQQSILGAARKYNVVACGRRFGKSILGTNRLIDGALRGFPVAWFAPTYKLLAPVWRECIRRLGPVIAKIDRTEKRIELVTGGSIEFWTMDGQDPARGREYWLVVVDEAAMVRYLGDLWQECIEPTLLTFDGSAWFLSTPKGLNFFHTLWQWGLDPNLPDWASHKAPTSANPTLKNVLAWLERKKLTVEERKFLQEYLAEFLSGEGAVFRKVGAAMLAKGQPGALPGHQYVAGVDWGRNHDHTVITVIDQMLSEVAYVDRFTGIEFTQQHGRLRAAYDLFRPTVMLCESNSIGQQNIESLQRMGLPVMPFHMSNPSKGVLVDGLTLALEQQSLKLLEAAYRNEDAVRIGQIAEGELLAFEGTTTRGGQTTYGAPQGMNDDTVVSLMLAWHAASAGVVGYADSLI
jgi:hypothetical protein